LIIAYIDSHKNALFGAVIACLIPSFHLFCDLPNIYFALFSLAIIYVNLIALKRNNAFISFFCGLLLSIALFFSMSFAVILFFIILISFLELKNQNKTQILRFIFLFSAGCLLPMIILLCFSYNTVEMLFLINKNNHEFYMLSSRGRYSAIGINLFELFLFAGVIWPILYFKAIPGFLLKNIPDIFKNNRTLANNFTLASMITVVLLLISGGVRGEIARNGTLVMPLMIIVLPLYYKLTRKKFILLTICSLICFVLICWMMEVSFTFIST